MTVEFRALENAQGRFYFRKRVALALLPCIILLTGLCLWIAWSLSDPEWHPVRRRLVGDLLLMLPWWARGTLFAIAAVFWISTFVVFVFHALDRKPDFTIEPDGISRNFLFRRFKLLWPDIRSVSLQADRIKIEGLRSGGSERGIAIEYVPIIFGGTNGEVLTLIRRYRPDIVTEEQILAATEPEPSIHQIPRA